MNTKKEEIMMKVENEGEVFIVSLLRDELEKMSYTIDQDFDFDYVKIYLLKSSGQYILKYRFFIDSSFIDEYTYSKEIGDRYFNELLDELIKKI